VAASALPIRILPYGNILRKDKVLYGKYVARTVDYP
jgi:hypothetical protein